MRVEVCLWLWWCVGPRKTLMCVCYIILLYGNFCSFSISIPVVGPKFSLERKVGHIWMKFIEVLKSYMSVKICTFVYQNVLKMQVEIESTVFMSVQILPDRMNIYTELNLATLPRLVNFKILAKFEFWILVIYAIIERFLKIL